MNISRLCFCEVQVLRARSFPAKSRRFVSETFQGRQECPHWEKICLHFRVKEGFSLWKAGWGGPQPSCIRSEFPNFRVPLKHTPLWVQVPPACPWRRGGGAGQGHCRGCKEPTLFASDPGVAIPQMHTGETVLGHLVSCRESSLRPFMVSDLTHAFYTKECDAHFFHSGRKIR